MKKLVDSIEIYASAEDIFNGIIKVLSTEEGYRMWSTDHVSCKWVKGKPFEKESVLYIEEYLHGKLHKMKFAHMNVVRNKSLEYKLRFPMSVICPQGSLRIIQNEESCTFEAMLAFRMSGILFKIAGNQVNALKNHMKEEGERLKAIVESKPY